MWLQPGNTQPLIARTQRAPQRRRNAAGLAGDVERLALRVLDDADDAAVTGEAPGRFDGQCRTVLQLATTRLVGVQRLGVDVHDDLVALAAVQRGGPSFKETLRDDDERIRTTCRVGGLRTFPRNREAHASQSIRQRNFRQGGLQRVQQQRAAFGRQLQLDDERAVVVVEVRQAPLRMLARFA